MKKTENPLEIAGKERKFTLNYWKIRYFSLNNQSFKKLNNKVSELSSELDQTKKVLDINNQQLNKMSHHSRFVIYFCFLIKY